MENKDIERKLKEVAKPSISNPSHEVQLKLTLLNAKRSANAGILLVLLPCIFLLCIFAKYLLHIPLTVFSGLEEWMAAHDHGAMKILMPLLLIGTPMVALFINLLSILHVQIIKPAKELLITVKLKWMNIFICTICVLILTCFLLYAIGENF